MFDIVLGREGLSQSYQMPFAESVNCLSCGGEARIALTAIERGSQGDGLICDLHKNDPGGEGFWPHDACAVAVYLCRKCLRASAMVNQKPCAHPVVSAGDDGVPYCTQCGRSLEQR